MFSEISNENLETRVYKGVTIQLLSLSTLITCLLDNVFRLFGEAAGQSLHFVIETCNFST